MDPDEQEAGHEAPEMTGADGLDGGPEERVTCILHGVKWTLLSLEKEKTKISSTRCCEASISTVSVSTEQGRWA